MNTRGLVIFFAIPVLTVTTLLFLNNAAFLGGVEQNRINAIKQQQDSRNSSSEPGAQAPSETELIQMLFQAIQEKNVSLSLGILDLSNFPNEDAVKGWQNQFTSFETAQISSIEAANQAEWTMTEHVYKVTINAKMLPEAASATIPNYGWQNGDNIRWIKLTRGEDNLWRVLEINTGP